MVRFVEIEPTFEAATSRNRGISFKSSKSIIKFYFLVYFIVVFIIKPKRFSKVRTMLMQGNIVSAFESATALSSGIPCKKFKS